MNPILKLFVLLIFAYIPFDISANEPGPDVIVKQVVVNVLKVLDDNELTEDEKKAKVYSIVKEHIHFKEMSRRILAINWKIASEEQQAEFIGLFEKILLNTYWSRLKRYAGEQVEYISVSQDSENTATVDTVIVSGKDIQIPISYRMKRFVTIWYAYDFTVENLSLVQSYRNEYRAVVKNFGIQGLLEHMQREIDTITSS